MTSFITRLFWCFQAFQPRRPTYPRSSEVLVQTLAEVMWDMQDLLWMLNELFGETLPTEQLIMAPCLWNFTVFTLESISAAIQQRVVSEQPLAPSANLELAREVSCGVCLTNLPTVYLRACGHVLCTNCALRLFRCPFCFAPVSGVVPIYLS